MNSDTDLSEKKEEISEVDANQYRSSVASLLYLAAKACPDLWLAASLFLFVRICSNEGTNDYC